MDKVYMEDLIVCTKARRGDGKSGHSPIRVVTEIFKANGEKVAESDPCGDICPETILDFLKYRYADTTEQKHIQNIKSYFIHGDDD